MGHSFPRVQAEVATGTACVWARSATARLPMRSPRDSERRVSGVRSHSQDEPPDRPQDRPKRDRAKLEAAHAHWPRLSSTIRAAMTLVDYLIVLLIVLSAVVGVARGFLREIIALVTWFIALFV